MKWISWSFSILIVAGSLSCRSNRTLAIAINRPPKVETPIELSRSEGIKNKYKDFEKLGYQKGSKVSDITLFSPEGVKFNSSEILKNGKPLLIISGSYTCDISRHNLPDVNAIWAKYKDKVNIYLIYTIDAHPSDVASPYSETDQVSLAKENVREHIEAKQPVMYGERKKLAQKWKQQHNLLVPLLVDNPTNDFWLAYGQAPNMAYLIDSDGRVYYRQTWFKYVQMDNAIREWIRLHS